MQGMRPIFGGQVLKGHLDLLLLAVLADGPRHGYAVMEELRRRSADTIDLPEGTVYPALHRLEEKGLLSSTWTSVEGRRRRRYELTQRGHGALAREREQWSAFTATVDGVLGGVAWNPT